MSLTWNELAEALLKSFGETALMTGWSLLISVVLGGLIGLFLFLTSSPLFIKNRIINQITGVIVNIIRSIPFVILLVMLLPLTKFLVGSTIGAKSVIVPLAFAATAFYARLAEGAFSDVPRGILEAASATGAHPFEIIIRILLPEALPQLISGITVTAISLIGYSAMSGTVGGGGVGDLAIRYGYQRYQPVVLLVCVALLIILVQIIQYVGETAARKTNRR